ncbi:MAG: phosphoenolpyruvate--protein phosphotransferase [Desulfatiglandaceae bacterium]
MTLQNPDENQELRGIPVSPGIIIGKAHLVDRSRVKIIYRYLIKSEQVEDEVKRLKAAVAAMENRLSELKNRMPEQARGHSYILDSHMMILKDSMLTDSSIEKIVQEKINAEWALKKSFDEISLIFSQIDDDYISRRINDVEYVVEGVLRNLSGEKQQNLNEINERVIIVAHDLSPSDTSELNIGKVMGFITDGGGKTSHTGILAQALNIPAVVGLESATTMVHEGDLLIVNGNSGKVTINPDDETIIFYQEKQLKDEEYKSSIARTCHLPSVTIDGHHVPVRANIEFMEEIAAVREYGGEGIGLYRTEFLYLRSKGMPPEEELFENYKDVAELIFPDPVTIRTLDLGGDKLGPPFKTTDEINPALGLRAIRFCLREKEIFKCQLRAILRASIYGKMQVMFPMISGVQEFLDAKAIFDEVKKELDEKGIDYDREMKVGIMIEVPSAVTMADALARHVDFFSIGTNDLIQYALASDRINEHVAHMFQPFHPAILRMIRHVVLAAGEAGIPVALCGEMAGDPRCIPVLLGLGLNDLSMNAQSIPLAKAIIRGLSIKETRLDFQKVISLGTATEVHDYIDQRIKAVFPETIFAENNFGHASA